MGKSKQEFMNSNEGKQTPRDFMEYDEPCNEAQRWFLEQKLEQAKHELEAWYSEMTSRIWGLKYESEAYEIQKEIEQYIDNSTDMRMKAIGKRVDNSVNRKNT